MFHNGFYFIHCFYTNKYLFFIVHNEGILALFQTARRAVRWSDLLGIFQVETISNFVLNTVGNHSNESFKKSLSSFLLIVQTLLKLLPL